MLALSASINSDKTEASAGSSRLINGGAAGGFRIATAETEISAGDTRGNPS
jgi:hypothetical protein